MAVAVTPRPAMYNHGGAQLVADSVQPVTTMPPLTATRSLPKARKHRPESASVRRLDREGGVARVFKNEPHTEAGSNIYK